MAPSPMHRPGAIPRPPTSPAAAAVARALAPGRPAELLLRNVLTGAHVGTAEIAIERLSDVASRRRGQSVARVTTAVPLTAAQEQQLTSVLGRLYGRPVGLQVTVEPDVLGGLVIQVGDEVIIASATYGSIEDVIARKPKVLIFGPDNTISDRVTYDVFRDAEGRLDMRILGPGIAG